MSRQPNSPRRYQGTNLGLQMQLPRQTDRDFLPVSFLEALHTGYHLQSLDEKSQTIKM